MEQHHDGRRAAQAAEARHGAVLAQGGRRLHRLPGGRAGRRRHVGRPASTRAAGSTTARSAATTSTALPSRRSRSGSSAEPRAWRRATPTRRSPTAAVAYVEDLRRNRGDGPASDALDPARTPGARARAIVAQETAQGAPASPASSSPTCARITSRTGATRWRPTATSSSRGRNAPRRSATWPPSGPR